MTSKIRNIEKKVLSDNWYTLNKYSYDYQKPTGEWERQEREAYDRGNGSTILLYNVAKQSVILTRQFRLPTFVNGNPDGMLIEACAGLLEEHNAEDCIKKEAEEETGYKIDKVEKIFEAYGTDQVEARYLLTPTFMQRLVDLEKSVDGKNIRFGFIGGQLLIAIETENRYEPGSMFKPLIETARTQKILDEIGAIYDVIDGVIERRR